MKQIEPYRFFFPIGLLGSILATLMWLVIWLNQNNISVFYFPYSNYPAIEHTILLFANFFLPVISGFVLTAIPRFTGTPFLNRIYLSYFFILHLVLLVLGIFNINLLFSSILLLLLISLKVFVIKKFFTSKMKTPMNLYLLVPALTLGTLGAISFLIYQFIPDFKFITMTRQLVFYGFLPMIILGLGSRMLVPIVMNLNPTGRIQWIQRLESMTKKEIYSFIILFYASFLLKLISLLTDNFYFDIVYRLNLLIIISYWMLKYFHILEYKNFSGYLPITILISAWMFVLGLVGNLFFFIHYTHIYFIGGLSLFVFSIMTRVLISHENVDINIEKTSRMILSLTIFMILTFLTRATANLTPKIYYSHLGYSSVMFVVYVIAWSFWIVFLIRKSNKTRNTVM